MNINGTILLKKEFKQFSSSKSVSTKINSINIPDTKIYREVRVTVYPKVTGKKYFLVQPE